MSGIMIQLRYAVTPRNRELIIYCHRKIYMLEAASNCNEDKINVFVKDKINVFHENICLILNPIRVSKFYL